MNEIVPPGQLHRSTLVFTMKTSLILGTIVWFLAINSSTFAQRNKEPYIAQSSESGEVTAVEIDSMAMDAKQTGERLFVIARLGTGETSQRINSVRLYNTRQNLEPKSFDQRSIVFASGDRVAGEGRIEFYLGSRLRLIVLAKRNKMPNLTCCPDYFPVRRRSARQRHR